MSATASVLRLPDVPPDPRTPEQRAADQKEYLATWRRERRRERAAVRRRARSMLELAGAQVVDVQIEQGGIDEYDDDCRVVLTLAGGRRVRIEAVSLDYDGEQATPVLRKVRA